MRSGQRPPRPDADVLERWQVADGTEFQIRPLRSDDAGQELHFVQSLSPQTRYERTFSHRGLLAPGELRKLIRFDVREEVALVAVVTQGTASAFAGIAHVIGYTFSTNEAMKKLARNAGFTLRSDPGDPSVTLLEIDLSLR